MNPSRCFLLAVLALVVGTISVPALPAEPAPAPAPVLTGTADPRMAPLDSLLTSFLAEHKIPGAAVAVARHNRLVYSRGFGYAEVETQTPVAPTALFRIASISKPLTAIAVLQLVEQGKLSLDEPAFERLRDKPEFQPHGTPDPRMSSVTIRQLLQHTGGWDSQQSFDPMFRSLDIACTLGTPPPAGPAEVIRYMSGRPLDFDPGARYAYCNYGYCVLGRLIELVSGQPYDDFVRRSVLAPLGITRMQLGKTLRSGRAEGEVCYYEPGSERLPAVLGPELGQSVPLPYGAWCLETMDAHGGWIASAVDLVRLAGALDDASRSPLRQASSLAQMVARPAGLAGYDKDGQPSPTYYGLGWFVRPVGEGPQCNAWHTGSLDGTSTILVRRHDGLIWAVLFNTRNAEPTEAPARRVDPLVHEAVNKIETWPEGEALLPGPP